MPADGRAAASSRPRRTSRPSPPTASAARRASTSPATRAATAPTRACARARAIARCCSTSRRTSRASTSGRRRRPYERAERLAAEAYGAGAHLVPDQRRDPGQPRAVPGAGAARRARSSCSATRTRSVIDGLVLQRRPADASSRPSTTTSSGWRTASRRRRSTRRWRACARRPRPRSSSRRPTTGWPPTSAACAEVAHAAGVAADRRPRLGRRTSASTPTLPEIAAARSAPTPCSPRRTRSSAA